MTSATYRNFLQSPAKAYEQFFVPAIATPVATELLKTAGLIGVGCSVVWLIRRQSTP